MSPSSKLLDTTDDDDDTHALEKLLAVAEAEEAQSSNKPTSTSEDVNVNDLEKLLAAAEADEAKSSSQSTSTPDNVNANDLEQLLAIAEADESKSTPQPTPATTIKTTVPRLREDSTFADAFSYDIDPVIDKASVATTAFGGDDLDSSDDEEIKNFLERKYNEYGRDINKKLKEQNDAKHEAAVTQEVTKAINKTPTAALKNPHNPIQRRSNATTASNSFRKVLKPENSATPTNLITNYLSPGTVSSVFTDPVFGLKLINPLVSSSGLVERMSGRTPIPFSTLAFHTQRGDLSKDWVVAGVLVSKSPVKTTKTGAPYSIWRLSDLKGEIKMISLFMFKTAHKKLWKTANGMAVAILNPSVFDKRAESGDVACLSIDTDQKVLILGQSKDLGTCKARKKNGEPCTATINLGDCDYCIFHMKQEYSKMSQRSELQSSTAGRGLNELRNKILGKSEVFYAGQSFTAVPAKKSAKLAAKDSQRLVSLSEYAISPNAASVNHTSGPREVKTIPYAARGGPVSKLASNVEANRKQRLKDMERLKILQEESARFSSSAESKVDTPSASVSANKPVSASTSSPIAPVAEKYKNREFSFASGSPQLSRENFSIEVKVGDRQANLAKLKAMQVLKKKPLAKANPNFIKYRGSSDGKRRAIDELNDKFGTESKRQKLEEDQREIDRKTRIQKIMEATSSHTNLVQSYELQEQEKYFNKLEKKEALEEKMLNTFKVPCKAVICVQCKYTAFSAADRCKEEKHPLKVIDTEKRFYQCKDCGNRTATVHKLPKMSCKNCHGSRWERTAMIRERKIDDGREMLSIRGDEEVFLGSVASKANLNLLVPE